MMCAVYAYHSNRVFVLFDRITGDEEAMSIVDELAIEEGYRNCPYLLQDGSMGAHGPNTCSMGCTEEPGCW